MTETLTLDEADALVRGALEAASTAPANAAHVARALVGAEAEGQSGHGLSRVASYAAQARCGKVAGFAAPVAETARPGLLRVDARHGFAYPALALARERLGPMARAQGIACAVVQASHHCGALGQQVEALAETGLVALMVANAPKAMAPWGGREPLFGTNPIAFAAPVADAAPLVIDLSLSKVARGKVMTASKLGRPIPEGWALDPEGQPTTDAKAALAGTMIPMGDAKGAALALMVEVLAGALAGPHFSFEASSFFDAEGPPPGVGQVLIAIDPAGAAEGLPARMAALLAAITAQDGARVPGAKRLAARAAAARDGLVVPRRVVREVRDLAAA